MARRWWSNLSDLALPDRVLNFVARQTDVRRPLHHLDSLFDDLGLDGDDAVEFFEAFEAEFRVDLEPLYRNWSRHFGPEGFPLALGLLLVVISSVVALPAAIAGLPLWAATGLGLGAGFGWLVGLRAWPFRGGRELQPVTIADLIRAADAGRWPECADGP